MNSSEYPISTDTLEKGSRVAPDAIEEIFNVRRGTDAFNLASLKLRSYIVWRLAERGLDVVCCADPDVKYGLRILTDEQRAYYTDRRFNVHLEGAGESLRKQAGTDRAQLSVETLARHDRALVINGRTYMAARRERQKDITPSSRRRLTPAR